MWQKPQSSRPTAEDAARRLVILKYIVVSALVEPPREILQQLNARWSTDECERFSQLTEAHRDKFWGGVREAGFWPFLSPHELAYTQTSPTTMSKQQQVDATWRMESVHVLMWALGLVPHLLPYDTTANHNLLKQIPARDMVTFIESAQLRDETEVDRAREVAEFWHWRSRTRQLIERGDVFTADEKLKAAGFHSYDDIVRFSARKGAQDGTLPPCIGDDFPAKGKAYRDLSHHEWAEVRSITKERHYTLNWLCGYAPDNKWDETPTGT
jgi:hypothetical protein